MADDERLREALFELNVLRDRERAALRETKDLLDCIEDYTAAEGPEHALQSIFSSLRTKSNADASFLAEVFGSGEARVIATDRPAWKSRIVIPPLDLTERSRNFVDWRLAGEWRGTINLSDYKALAASPHSTTDRSFFLATLRKGEKGFKKDGLKLINRLAGLAVQAVQSKDIEAENALLAASVQGSSSGFAIADATVEGCPLIYVNRAFEEISGYEAKEVIGKNCRFLTAEPVDSPERERLRKTVKTRSAGSFLVRNRRKNGELFWNELSLFPVRDASGRTLHVVATQTDATERVKASEDRDLTRLRMEQALTTSEDAYLVLDNDQRVEFVNSATKTIFSAPSIGWEVGSSFADNWADYIDAADQLPGRVTSLLRQANLDALAELGRGQEVELPSGRNVLLRATRLDDGGKVLSATDVTPIRSAQVLLAQRLAAIEAAQDGIAIVDDNGRILYLNSAAAHLLGYEKPDLALGRLWHSKYDDSPSSGSEVAFELTLTRKEEGRTRTHEIRSSPLETGGSVMNFRDVSERLATEAREAELKTGLLRLQRQGAIAQLTAGIAHDFNNLLSAINGSATLIGMNKGIPDEVVPHVERIEAAGVQAARLVNKLLDVGSSADGQASFDITTALSDLHAVVEPSLPNGVQLKVAEITEPYLLRGDPGAFNQVLVNLVLNAGDAMSESAGLISVAFKPMKPRQNRSVASGELFAGREYLCLKVSDTGHGMSEEVLGSVFEPYFTTKGRLGTGLGLPMVAMQLQSIGGAVDINSAVGRGTSISIYWPIGRQQVTTEPGEAAGAHDLKGMTIVVADDDENVAGVLASYLEKMGAEVSVCTDPVDAAEAIEDSPADWSALVTDYDMPTLNGGALVERVRKATKNLPIFVVTALARRLADPRISDETVNGTFAKPVDLDQLGGALAKASAAREVE